MLNFLVDDLFAPLHSPAIHTVQWPKMQKCYVMLMQISIKKFFKFLGESPWNDWEKWEKSKTKTNLPFLLHFMLTWHLSESMFCHLNMCCALFCIFCARLRLEPKKSDSNITLVNRRPMGKWYIYIYWMMLVKANILCSSLWLDFDLTPGQAFADQLH